ncbi:24325_t:CDS:2, partial [Entrophospora sp. SA101]
DKSDKEEKSIVTDNDDAIDDNKESFHADINSSNSSSSSSSNKRKLDDQDNEDDKLTCKLEKWNNAVVNVINGAGDSQVEIDLFCKQNWRDELCRCKEETYEPPKDDDESQTSIFESGMKILNQMDRVSAIEGAIAFSKL